MPRTHDEQIELIKVFGAIGVTIAILAWGGTVLTHSTDESIKKLFCGLIGTVVGYWIK